MIRAVLCVALLFGGVAQAVEVDRIDRWVERLMAADRVPGLALVVIDDGAVVHARGFGEACPGVAVTPTTRFRLGSMSKSFTALAVLQLVARGAVELDAPARRYLPDLTLPDAVTVRHLLHHTSGLPTRAPIAGDGATLAAHVAALDGVALLHPPGTQHVYSSANYQVLGRLVEVVGAAPFAEQIRGRIYAPLGMAWAPADACGHRYWAGFPLTADLPAEPGRAPTAALAASADDLAKYLIALMNRDESIVPPGQAAALFTPGENAAGYAMGWRARPLDGVDDAVHHGGSLPHFRGKLIMLPSRRGAVIVLTNASSMIGRVTSHVIANGVATIVAGGTPRRSRQWPLKWLLGLIGLGLAIVSFELIGEVRRREHLAEQRRAALAGGTGKRIKAIVALLWGLLVPPFVLIGLPLIGLPLPHVIRAMPDVGWWVVIYLPLAFLLAVWHLWRLKRPAASAEVRA